MKLSIYRLYVLFHIESAGYADDGFVIKLLQFIMPLQWPIVRDTLLGQRSVRPLCELQCIDSANETNYWQDMVGGGVIEYSKDIILHFIRERK